MTLEMLFEKLDQLADVPDAIPKMRALILELAIQGKLVKQYASEGNSDLLLSQIREQNAPLKYEEVSTASELVLGPLPSNWNLSSLGEVCTIVRGVSFPGSAKSITRDTETVACLRTASVQAEIDWNDLIYIPQEFVGRDDQWVMKHDIMISMANSYTLVGKVAIVRDLPQKTTFGAFLAAIRPVLIDPFYLLYVLRSPRMQAAFRSSSSQTTNIANISLSRMRPLPFPLPPTAEQKRIVAKVDELMALCDRLEAQQKERETRHDALTLAAITRFDEAPTPANLNFLFHPSYSVTPADLRKTILNLAVQGKLVPQNSGDDSAVECLASCGVRGREAFPERPSWRHTVPPGWVWLWFAAAGEQRLGKMLDTQKNRGELKPYLRNTNVQWMRFELNDVKNMRIDVKELDELRLQKGDLLICEGGEPGRCAIWNEEIPEMYFQKALHRIRPCKAILPEYLALNLELDSQNGVLDGYFTGATIKHLTGRSLARYPIPIPPLLEQQRIVARIDQLMGLVGQLEVQLTASEKTAGELLDAVIHELLHPTADVIELTRSGFGRSSQRAAIGCYAIEHLKRNPSFGHTMNMKVVYMAQAHIGLPLDLKFERQAAGPWHPWIEEFDTIGQSEGWFTVTQKSIGDGRTKYEYVPKAALKQKVAEAASVLGEHRAEFDRLLGLFADLNTEKAEIVATLFAAWNDFLLDGKTPTDDEIIREVRENWHLSKERFTPTRLQRWLDWMRRHRLTPKGLGPRTRQQLSLGLG